MTIAPWSRRVASELIDFLVLALVGVAVLPGFTGDLASDIGIGGVTVAITLLYGPLLMLRGDAHNGQTLGKQALRIRVVRDDGAPMELKRGMVRDIVGKWLLWALPLYTVADVLAPLFDSGNRALHDRIARTHVVWADAASPHTIRGFEPPGSTPA